MLNSRPGSLRALAQPFIESGVRQGLNSARIVEALDAGGLTYRRTVMLSDIRFYQGRAALTDRLNSVRLDYRPGADLFSPARGYQSRDYKITVELGVRRADGSFSTEYRSISTDRLMTRGQMLDEGAARGPGYLEDRGDEIVSSSLYAIDFSGSA